MHSKETQMPTPNDNRSRVKDPMQADFKHDRDNRSGQLDPRQHKQGGQAQQGTQEGVKSRQGAGAGRKK